MDTQEKREKEEQGKKALHPSVQVRLGKEDLFFGPGKAWLMECIEETGSMQEACTKMDSASNFWNAGSAEAEAAAQSLRKKEGSS